jgi:malate/lactate dehydrogenase
VIADRAAGGEWQGEEGLQLVARLSQLAPNACLVCAGSSQRDLVDRGVHELHVERRRLFGSAPEALAAAARALVALAVDASPQDVALSVVGVPPASFIVPWEDATVAGFRAIKLMDEPSRRRVARRIAAAWPPGPYALAAAVCKTLDAMSGRTREVVSCFVAPQDGGRQSRTAAMPVRLAASGITHVVLPRLDVVDRIALDNAILY